MSATQQRLTYGKATADIPSDVQYVGRIPRATGISVATPFYGGPVGTTS